MKDNQKDNGSKGQEFLTKGYISVSKCRICESENLTEFLNLGNQPLANSFLKEIKSKLIESVYPLRVLFCHDCNLVQLGEIVSPKVLFWNYVYFSSGMPASEHFRKYAKGIINEFIKNPKELVVEIGSNDGHFLAVVKEEHPYILGVDPAQNIAKQANDKGIPTIPQFFSKKIAEKIYEKYGRAKVIVGNNVIAHIDEYHDLFSGIKELLSQDGVLIFEAPYLIDMFENLTFDTIYHEHLSYLAICPLKILVEKFGLQIFRVEIHPIQGSSIRVFVGHKGRRSSESSVERLIQQELALNLDKVSCYKKLAIEIYNLKKEVVSLVKGLKKQGKRLAGYGAPAKGNTLLNFFGIGASELDFVTESLPSKIGLYTPGTHIPVKDIEWASNNSPDYYFLLAWNYKDVILNKEKKFRANGGKFIMPVGRKRII